VIPVLIIDNDNITKNKIEEFLKDYDTFIYSASDVETAYGILVRYSPAIVFINIELRGLYSGIEYFDLIENINYKPANIVLTSQKNTADLKYSFNKSVSGYLFKPLDEKHFAKELHKVCEEYNICINQYKFVEHCFIKENLTVLLINDQESILKLHSIFLQKIKQFKCVVPSFSGEHALSVLKYFHSKVDIILLDWMMPKMSGLEFLKDVKTNPLTNSIPVVIFSGDHDKDSIKTALKEGADNYITIPCDSSEIQRKTMEILKASYRAKILKNTRIELREKSSI
jgi:response regulator of citrate/malate metabolism